MFRIKNSDTPERRSIVTKFPVVVLATSLLALGNCVILNWRELRLSYALRESLVAIPPQTTEALEESALLVLMCTSLTALWLLFSLIGLIWFTRKYPRDQDSLRKLKMLAHNILASMDHGVITTDCDGVITSINTAGIQLLGVQFECVGQKLTDLQVPGLPLHDLSQLVISGKTPVSDSDFSLQSDENRRRIRIDSHALKDGNDELCGCVIHLRNVTDRVLLEERMSRMERFINLGALSSGLHHEIKNPLTALSIHVQLLEECLQQPLSEEPVEDILGVLKTEISRLNGVLEGFRNFTNLQKMSLQSIDVSRSLKSLVRLVKPQASLQAVEISLNHIEGSISEVQLDQDKFDQAVLNLMINALDAMPDGGLLSIVARQQGSWIQVEVADTGSGIPKELRSQIFKPYFSTKTNGTGMGLALAEKLIGQHGGHIDVSSEPAGTTFQIHLPMVQE